MGLKRRGEVQGVSAVQGAFIDEPMSRRILIDKLRFRQSSDELKSGSPYSRDKVQWVQMDKVKFREVSAVHGQYEVQYEVQGPLQFRKFL